jgi:hypothetical protein
MKKAGAQMPWWNGLLCFIFIFSLLDFRRKITGLRHSGTDTIRLNFQIQSKTVSAKQWKIHEGLGRRGIQLEGLSRHRSETLNPCRIRV